MTRPKLIGLTGNIGSGKSTVANLLVEKGAVLIDADVLARAATHDKEVLNTIAEKLGKNLVVGGTLDRAKTASLVFNNKEARQTLNSIIHPWVRAESNKQVEMLINQTPPPIVILLDIPLLFENGLDKGLDAVIVVNASLKARIKRVMTRNKLTEDEIRARDSAQLPLEDKVLRADYVIDNEGDLESLKKTLDKLWLKLIAKQ